jgi:hypothetical protein
MGAFKISQRNLGLCPKFHSVSSLLAKSDRHSYEQAVLPRNFTRNSSRQMRKQKYQLQVETQHKQHNQSQGGRSARKGRTVRKRESRAAENRTGADCPPFTSGRSAGCELNTEQDSTCRASKDQRRTVRLVFADCPPVSQKSRRSTEGPSCRRSKVQARTVRHLWCGLSALQNQKQNQHSALQEHDARTVRRQVADGPPSGDRNRQSSESKFQTGSKLEIHSNDLQKFSNFRDMTTCTS